ncbi:MAG: MgtC/SapB family protein [Proteobacteria bacterium]|nr:MgtC/SapB family protein [Pseudomonadota bacterium]
MVADARADGLLVALAVGLLIGAERERRKGEGEARGAAGIRTFGLAALVGALGRLIGGELVLAAAIAGVSALAAAAYLRSRKDDPGLTTEIALVLTTLLGALAASDPAVTAAVGVSVVALLAVRTPLHRFIRNALSEAELRDALILAIATFVVWPFLPSNPLDLFGALNLHAIWLVVILVMVIGALGHVAVRLVGARLGIPIAGFFSGFISSSATIGALGAQAAKNSAVRAAAVAGAVLSTVATVLQMGVLLAAIDLSVLRAMTGSLLIAGLTAAIYAAFFVITAARNAETPAAREHGHAFGIGSALLFGLLFSLVLLASGALRHWFGDAGALAGAAMAGLIDVHAASASLATLAANGVLGPQHAAAPILAAFSSNTLTKILLAFGAGDRAFAVRVAPGLVLVAAAAWAGVLVPLD